MGRGCALLVVAVLCFLSHFEGACGATYVVGDRRGWTFNVANWPDRKIFRAGDVLIFRYNPSFHNVVAVNPADYRSCAAPRASSTLTSGNDRVTLKRGLNSFICTYAGHCQAGMKIQVSAT
ncbi:basic blue protein-like [Nymphaea colorata]|nr:basic blue protein-like [Nymphaea colorata]